MNLRLGVLLVAIVAFTSFGLAQPGNRPGRMMDGKRHDAIMKKLNLTDKQKADIDRLHSDMQKAMIENRAKIQEARVDLKALFKADNPDRAAIEKKMTEINDLQLKAKMAFVGHLFSVRDLLTPEQQKIWKDHMIEEGMGGGEMNGMQGGMMRNPQHQMHQGPGQK